MTQSRAIRQHPLPPLLKAAPPQPQKAKLRNCVFALRLPNIGPVASAAGPYRLSERSNLLTIVACNATFWPPRPSLTCRPRSIATQLGHFQLDLPDVNNCIKCVSDDSES